MPILPGVSGNMNKRYDRLMCIDYQMCDGYYHTKIHKNVSISNVNINSTGTLKWNVLNREHAQEHIVPTILLTCQLCLVRLGIMIIILFVCG